MLKKTFDFVQIVFDFVRKDSICLFDRNNGACTENYGRIRGCTRKIPKFGFGLINDVITRCGIQSESDYNTF